MTTWGRCEEGYPFPSPMIPCGTALIFRMLVVRHSLNGRSVIVCACLSERKSEWMCEMSVFVFLFFLKKKPTQWSYLIWSEFGPALIGNDRKIACEPSWRWAAGESTNSRASTLVCCGQRWWIWSDILVLCGFGFISNLTVDTEYRGDSDLTTTKIFIRPLALLFVLGIEAAS